MSKKITKIKKVKEPLLSQVYLEYFDKYKKIYGENKTIIFMQVGGFYESYALDESGPDLLQLSKITGVIRTRKNKSINSVTLSNPYILGFPVAAITKYTEILLDNDYVIVIIDQIPKKKTGKNETREVTNIYSKGTYIENIEKREGNYIVCIYISNENSLLCTGITGIDVSTGHVYIHEACSSKYDESYSLDEIDRFISTFNPSEILFYYDSNNKLKKDKNNKYDKDYILTYLKLSENECRFFESVENKYTNCICQNEIFDLVYKDSKSLITPIEQLNLEKNTYINASLCLIFDFIYDKNSLLVNNLEKPCWFSDSKKLVLGNNAIKQLDILENTNQTNKCRYRSLFHVVNKTSTALGERFLKHRLLSPLVDPKELKWYYDKIETICENNYYKNMETHLDSIRDIERLQRKLELRIIKPFEFTTLLSSYENIMELIITIKNFKSMDDLLPKSSTISKIENFIKHCENIFDLEELCKYSNYDFEKTNIFNVGIHEDIDNVGDSVNCAYNQIEKIRDHLDSLIKTANKQCVHIKKNGTHGYHLCLSNLNADKLQIKLKKLKILIIDDKKIDASLLEFKKAKNVTKIFISSIDQQTDEIEDYDKQFTYLCKKYFLDELDNIHFMYASTFKECNLFVATTDFIKSCSKSATLYGYSKPAISKTTDKSSFVDVKNLRHPIIERIIDYEYVPHDLILGKDLKGMLLFGTNSSGKSSLMKAIGLGIIMAQAGMFVPAESFNFFPYTTLFTRITGDDNIFRGLSSFTLEMVEINAILKRSGKNTLVIGDEVCRGTEHISGTAIVSSTIIKLSDTNSSFIFATHLHELMQIEEIKQLNNVKSFHLGVTYNDKNKTLIYDRILKEGSGNQLYGITVAQYIIQDKSFIDMAITIKNKLLNLYESLICSGKSSHYNNNVIVHKCHICGEKDKKCNISQLETHHINFQKDCENGFVKNKKHIKKNQEANLTVLCTKCHDKIHNGQITLQGYKMTSNGKTIIIS